MRIIFVLLLITLTSACAFAPGSNISAGSNRWFSAEDEHQKDNSIDWEEKINIQWISPNLIDKLTVPVAPPQGLPHNITEAVKGYDYQIGIGDILNITVWDHPELTIPQGSERSPTEAGNWVHSDGTIFFPYVGKIMVKGLNVGQVREKITAALSKFIPSPQIDVTVAAFRSKKVYVTGEVKQPGPVPITNIPLTLLDAVNAAAGLEVAADWQNVVVTRDGKETVYSLQRLYQQGDLTQNTLLQDGDVVHVSRNDDQKVFVLGEVVKAQPIPIQRSRMTLAEALASAGGLNELQANASGVFVLRTSSNPDNVADVYQLDASNALALVLADQFPLQSRDIVYVTAAPIARWNRLVQQLLPTILGAKYLTEIESRTFSGDN